MNGSMTVVAATAFVTLLAGCGSGQRIDPGPDEFSILPKAALADPSPAELPPPGGSDRAEPNPFALAYAALGGSGGATGPMPGAGALGVRPGGWLACFRAGIPATSLIRRRKRPD